MQQPWCTRPADEAVDMPSKRASGNQNTTERMLGSVNGLPFLPCSHFTAKPSGGQLSGDETCGHPIGGFLTYPIGRVAVFGTARRPSLDKLLRRWRVGEPTVARRDEPAECQVAVLRARRGCVAGMQLCQAARAESCRAVTSCPSVLRCSRLRSASRINAL